jgi:hypothetical protein
MIANKPTAAMIGFATSLIKQLGYDIDDYDFDNMTFAKCSNLISELKAERSG